MTVYHGSDVEVKEPKLLKLNRRLDFGAGRRRAASLIPRKRSDERGRKVSCLLHGSIAVAMGETVTAESSLVTTREGLAAITDDLAGANPATFPLDPSGTNAVPATSSSSRFFRLKAVER